MITTITTEQAREVLRRDTLYPFMFCERLAHITKRTPQEVQDWLQSKVGRSIPSFAEGSVHMDGNDIVVTIPDVVHQQHIMVENAIVGL